MTDRPRYALRQLETHEDYEACVRLQRKIWGENFHDVVPATILIVSQQVGGVTAGAFDASGRLIGFVFGISGVKNGELAHWSDMLAVRPEARGLGLGKRLKFFQRDLLLAQGIKVAYWTYDPLIAQNANLNLNGLGAMVVEYVANMYGDTGSTLHAGLDTDRFVVKWQLAAPRAKLNNGASFPPPEALAAPVVNPDAVTGHAPHARGQPLPTTRWVRVMVPPDIEQVKIATPDDARLWQLATRRAFQQYLANGYRVAAFHYSTDPGRSFYLVTSDPDQA